MNVNILTLIILWLTTVYASSQNDTKAIIKQAKTSCNRCNIAHIVAHSQEDLIPFSTTIDHKHGYICTGCKKHSPGWPVIYCPKCHDSFCPNCKAKAGFAKFGNIILTYGMVNDNGDPAKPSPRNKKYYCGMFYGTKLLSGTNGFCGPNGGPQCDACIKLQKIMENQESPKKRFEFWNILQKLKDKLKYKEEKLKTKKVQIKPQIYQQENPQHKTICKECKYKYFMMYSQYDLIHSNLGHQFGYICIGCNRDTPGWPMIHCKKCLNNFCPKCKSKGNIQITTTPKPSRRIGSLIIVNHKVVQYPDQ